MKQGYEAFCLAVRTRESSNNYLAVNKFGYLGAYQFGMARLCDLGIARRKDPLSHSLKNDAFDFCAGITKDIFLNSPHLQDSCFDMHIHRLKNVCLKRYPGLDKGIAANGQPIDLSGALMACHLCGLGALDDFIHAGLDDKDANGTKVSDYIKLFAAYAIP